MAIQDYISNRHLDKEGRYSHAPTGILDRTPVSIKVIGVGSGGCNSVKRMMRHPVPGTTFAMVNTDNIVLEANAADVDVIQIGANKARAWGAGVDYTADDGSSDESTQQLRQSISNADLVFITAGMGGGTGTGAAPYVAHLAKEQGALVLGLVTAPFSFEGRRRMALAVAGFDQLRPYVDNLILVHNDRLLTFFERDAEMIEAFRTADEVVAQGIMGLSNMINVPQEMNVDFEAMSAVMNHRGGVLMAIGKGNGDTGPFQAARQAVANPLLDLSFENATGALVMIKGGGGAMTLGGVNAARKVITAAVGEDAKIHISVGVDDSLGDEVSLTLIATGLRSGPDVRTGSDRSVITKGRHP